MKRNNRAETCRRERFDRRKADNGPPAGWSERRRSVERRLPEVEEGVVSHEVWSEYFSAYKARLHVVAEQQAATSQAVADGSEQAV